MGEPEGAITTSRGWLRPIALLVIVAAIIALAEMFHVGQKLADLQKWVAGLGPWAPVAFMLIYVVGTVAAIPASALTVAAGAMFGTLLGVVYVSIASTVGAAAAFLISRYVARDAVAHWLSSQEKYARLDKMVEEHGAIVVALARLIPILPYTLLNYGFGLTRVRFWTYFFWSWLCMFPGTILYVVGADAVTTALSKGEVPWRLAGVFLFFIVVLAFLIRAARRKIAADDLNSAADDSAKGEETKP